MKKPEVIASSFESYRVQSVIGEGGTGIVYAGEAEDGSPVAIKCLRPETRSTDARRRFKNEAFFCLRNQHPGILTISDFGLYKSDAGESPFYVMPRFDGTMRDAARASAAPDARLGLISQILDGVEAAHLKGCWHRDLKPENILWMRRDNRLVVADFGIAHFAEADLETAVRTRDQSRLANFVYASPEQRRLGASGSVDHRADIYALGLIVNEMFTGEVPAGAEYKTVGAVVSTLAWLDGVINQMIRQDPSARHDSIATVKRQLIGLGQQRVVQQRLDALTHQVVPTTVPSVEDSQPIGIAGVDWEDNTLRIRLSRAPSPGWIQQLRQPMSGLAYFSGSGPTEAHVSGDLLVVHAPEERVQETLNQYRAFLDRASQSYARLLREEAQRRDAALRQQLQQQQAKETARLRVLSKLQ